MTAVKKTKAKVKSPVMLLQHHPFVSVIHAVPLGNIPGLYISLAVTGKHTRLQSIITYRWGTDAG